jgi:hypothetical protein
MTTTIAATTTQGRIPVLRPDSMSDEQKQVYDRINRSTVPWATNAGFQVKADGGGLLGPYNAQLLNPGTDAGYLDMLDAEKKQTSLSKRVREVIILSVGAVWKSDYEITRIRPRAGRQACLSRPSELSRLGAYRTIWRARKRSPSVTRGNSHSNAGSMPTCMPRPSDPSGCRAWRT